VPLPVVRLYRNKFKAQKMCMSITVKDEQIPRRGFIWGAESDVVEADALRTLVATREGF